MTPLTPPLPRLAWFSPMPPIRTGVAAYSADVLAGLRGHYQIDVFIDQAIVLDRQARPAHEFVWRHRQAPYELTVYQLGNSAQHEYIWPYVFRFPGLAVLHDARLHHARAAALLRQRRAGDYRAEFAASHPGVSADLAELAVKGFDSNLYYAWPMRRLVVESSRLTAVHSRPVADEIAAELPAAAVEVIRLGHGTATIAPDSGARARQRYGIPPDAVVFGCFGGLSPEKRLPQILDAFASVRGHVPGAHLLLAGGAAEHYDVRSAIAAHGLQPWTTLTGYLDREEDLTASIAAADVGITLRWPTAREISGPWLRCLAAARPTIAIQLTHLVDVPALDPRTWLTTAGTSAPDGDDEGAPVCVAIDILDEDHSLRLAMRRLATDSALRESLGRAARRYWEAHHTVDGMVADYRRAMASALQRPVPEPRLPAHLIDGGDRHLRRLLEPFGVASPLE